MWFEENEQAAMVAGDDRREWVKPELRRLDAGSAENSFGSLEDFAMNPS